jgi:hypothetical protein
MSKCLPDMPRYIWKHQDGSWYGADHQNGPWRPIPAPQSGLPWKTDGPAVQSREPASVAADPIPLSFAAQAVLDAFWKQPGDRSAIAAALRAAADQVFPEECPPYDAFLEWLRLHPDDSPPWQVRAGKRAELLAIAAELEGSNG